MPRAPERSRALAHYVRQGHQAGQTLSPRHCCSGTCGSSFANDWHFPTDDERPLRRGAGRCHASSATSASRARRSSAGPPGSVTASASVLIPMQQSPSCEMRVIIAAQPGSGPNGYIWVIREPAMYTGKGTPGMLETWTSLVLVSRPEIVLTTGAGSQPIAEARAAVTVSAVAALPPRPASQHCPPAATLAARSVSAMGAANLAPVNRL